MPLGTDVTITAQQSGQSTWNLAITQYQAQLGCTVSTRLLCKLKFYAHFIGMDKVSFVYMYCVDLTGVFVLKHLHLRVA